MDEREGKVQQWETQGSSSCLKYLRKSKSCSSWQEIATQSNLPLSTLSQTPFLTWDGAARSEWPLVGLARAISKVPSSSAWIAQTLGISARTARRWKSRLIRKKLLHERDNLLYPTLTFEQKSREALCVPLCFVLGDLLTSRQALALAAQRSEQRGREAFDRYWIRSDAERASRVGVGISTMARVRRKALSHNLIRIRYHRRGRAKRLTTVHVDERWIWGAKPGSGFRRRSAEMPRVVSEKSLRKRGQYERASKYPTVGTGDESSKDPSEEFVPKKWISKLIEKGRIATKAEKLPPIDRQKVREDLADPQLIELARLAADGHTRVIWQILRIAKVSTINEKNLCWITTKLARYKASPALILDHCTKVWNTLEPHPHMILRSNLEKIVIQNVCSVVAPRRKKETAI